MPAEGFISGLLGGLAGGAADTMWQQHQQQIEQDMQQKGLQLQFIREAINSPNFKPEFLPVAFESIQQIIGAKPGSKKGKAQSQSAFGGFTGKMNPKPSAEKLKEIDPTGRRTRTAQQEREAPGQFNKGFSPLPSIDPMFKSADEQTSDEFRAQKPMLDYRDEQARKAEQGRSDLEQQREEGRIRLEEKRIAGRMMVESAKSEAKATGNIRGLTAAYEATGMDHDQAVQMAAGDYIQSVQEKHNAAADKRLKIKADIEHADQRIAQSNQRLKLAAQRVAQGDSRIQLQARKLNWDMSSKSIMKEVDEAERSVSQNAKTIDQLTKQRESALQLQPKTTAEIQAKTEILRDLESKLNGAEQGYNNAQAAAANARQRADRLADDLMGSSSSSGLSPVPSSGSKKPFPSSRLKDYADKHNNGDLDAARKELTNAGYFIR